MPMQAIEESGLSQCLRILDHLRSFGRLTTIEGRRDLGILNVAQRISELRKKGYPIETTWVYQPDETGAVHRVACYLWKGGDSRQRDLWEAAKWMR